MSHWICNQRLWFHLQIPKCSISCGTAAMYLPSITICQSSPTGLPLGLGLGRVLDVSPHPEQCHMGSRWDRPRCENHKRDYSSPHVYLSCVPSSLLLPQGLVVPHWPLCFFQIKGMVPHVCLLLSPGKHPGPGVRRESFLFFLQASASSEGLD